MSTQVPADCYLVRYYRAAVKPKGLELGRATRGYWLADIPLIAHPAPGLLGEDARFVQAVGVVTITRDRVGDPGEVSGEGARHSFMPVLWCMPEYSWGCEAHDQQGSKVPSTMYCARGLRSSATGTYRASAAPSSVSAP